MYQSFFNSNNFFFAEKTDFAFAEITRSGNNMNILGLQIFFSFQRLVDTILKCIICGIKLFQLKSPLAKVYNSFWHIIEILNVNVSIERLKTF